MLKHSFHWSDLKGKFNIQWKKYFLMLLQANIDYVYNITFLKILFIFLDYIKVVRVTIVRISE